MFDSIKLRKSPSAPLVIAVPSKPAPKTGDPGFKGEVGECLVRGDGATLLGIGDPAKLDATQWRLLGARLGKFLVRRAPRAIRLDLAAAKGKPADQLASGQAFGEGLGVAHWRFDQFVGTASKLQPRLKPLVIDPGTGQFAVGLARGLSLAEGVNEARRLAATPPNICSPTWVAAEARRIARRCGLKCNIIDARQAARLGMGALLAVGQGSDHSSCLVHLVHRPRRVERSARGKRLVLVGKTITYDTGGYSLKVNNGMKGMKYDKCGGMTVLAAMERIAALEVPVEVHCVMAVAENMISSGAYRPDDIIRASNGVSIEVTNTDAEGRLVLCDALAWAAKELKPTAIVDMATLTGGVVVALGNFSAGYFCNDAGLRSRVEGAAATTGEKIWRLPLWNEHRDYMRSQHADLLNSNPGRGAHPIQGAAFLSFFVPESLPWCHIDIAGVANSETANEFGPAGPTGWGVRTLVELAESFGGD